MSSLICKRSPKGHRCHCGLMVVVVMVVVVMVVVVMVVVVMVVVVMVVVVMVVVGMVVVVMVAVVMVVVVMVVVVMVVVVMVVVGMVVVGMVVVGMVSLVVGLVVFPFPVKFRSRHGRSSHVSSRRHASYRGHSSRLLYHIHVIIDLVIASPFLTK